MENAVEKIYLLLTGPNLFLYERKPKWCNFKQMGTYNRIKAFTMLIIMLLMITHDAFSHEHPQAHDLKKAHSIATGHHHHHSGHQHHHYNPSHPSEEQNEAPLNRIFDLLMGNHASGAHQDHHLQFSVDVLRSEKPLMHASFDLVQSFRLEDLSSKLLTPGKFRSLPAYPEKPFLISRNLRAPPQTV
jgi:hypothetical protein